MFSYKVFSGLLWILFLDQLIEPSSRANRVSTGAVLAAAEVLAALVPLALVEGGATAWWGSYIGAP